MRKNIQLICQKYYEVKYVDLLLIGEEGKRQYVLIKDFDTLMYGHSGKKNLLFLFTSF